MIVNNFDGIGAVFRPHETDAPLVVDANAVLSFAIIFQCFEPIGWRNFQIVENLGFVQHEQFAQSDLLNVTRQLARHFSTLDFFSFLGCEADDHA